MYAVSPRTLGCEPTKEASRQAANEWWAKKLAEIDEALGKAKRHPANLVQHYEEAIENHRLFAKWHRKYGNLQEAERSEEMMEWLKEALASDNPPFPLTTSQADPRWGNEPDGDGIEVSWMMMPMKLSGSRGSARSERMSDTKKPFQKRTRSEGTLTITWR